MIFADPQVQAVFADYQARDAAEAERTRQPGVDPFAIRDELLLPVGPDVGRVLHALVLARQPRRILELGTSYGYSTLILADAARTVGGTLVTMELADYKQAHAVEQIGRAGLSAHVDFRLGDALELLAADARAGGEWDFVLLDIWKELYAPCFEAFYPHLAEEGIVASDNMIFPPGARENVRAFRAAMAAKGDMQHVLLPFGHGLEMCVRWSRGNAKL
jgi:predicted O-methyltransferase YrrM